jgi:hypothetical protein
MYIKYDKGFNYEYHPLSLSQISMSTEYLTSEINFLQKFVDSAIFL